MSGLYPLPTTRTSNLLIQSRLLTQVQYDQLSILRLQDQVSTGRRIAIPSDDPQASIKAFGLTRLLAQKQQAKANLVTTQSYLAASDTAMASLSGLLIDARALAVTAADSTTGEAQRAALLANVRYAIQQITDAANQQFRGRYLFGGSLSGSAPFTLTQNGIQYNGNDVQFQSFGDIDFLVASSVSGVDLFGAISTQKQGSVDFNPIVTSNTRLADLRQGVGIRKGSIEISDGNVSRTIDLSSAITVGDVIQLIESNPPPGRSLAVRVRNDHLEIQFNDGLLGNLTVREVGHGTTAAELGILETVGVGNGVLIGTDLHPVLTPTTRLADVFGTRSYARMELAGANNDIQIEAKSPGSSTDGYRVQLVDHDKLQAAAGINAGSEFVEFSAAPRAAQASVTFHDGSLAKNDIIITAAQPGSEFNNVRIMLAKQSGIGAASPTASYGVVGGVKTLTITIDDAVDTPISAIKNAINSLTIGGEQVFIATDDNSANGGDGTGSVSYLAAPGQIGNTGSSGGDANTYYVYIDPDRTTANQVISALNSNAEFADLFTASLDGKDTKQIPFLGTGVVSDNAAPAITSGGTGTPLDLESGVIITQGTQTTTVRFHGAETIEDLINAFQSSGAAVRARINADGTGLDLVTTLSGVDFTIGENGGTTATQLGLRTFSETTSLSQFNYGVGVGRSGGVDFVITRNDGVELNVNLSGANTVGDVLNLINNHPDNVGPDKVVARLAAVGNGIEIVDDNPQNGATLTIRRASGSSAAWDLGLIPRNVEFATPADGTPGAPATAQLNFAAPENLNSRISLSANQVGDFYNGVRVVFVAGASVGDAATATFDKSTKTLTVDIDPGATTAATIADAITAEGTFTASLDRTIDPSNDGSQTISQLGTIAHTAGGYPGSSAGVAQARVSFPAPNDQNTALRFTARIAGAGLNDVEIRFLAGGVGDTASVSYDASLKRLDIVIDPTQTTALTVANEVNAYGLFDVALDLEADPTNDGSGLIGTTGLAGVTSGGSAEVIKGTDRNPQETEGALTALFRLAQALEQNDPAALSRAAQLVEMSIDQVNYIRGAAGSHSRALDILSERLEEDNIELRQTLSDEIEVDLTEAISNLLARQASYEASLQLMGQTFRLSLLDYL